MTGAPVVVPLVGELEEAEAALLAELEAGVGAAMARLAEAERVAPAEDARGVQGEIDLTGLDTGSDVSYSLGMKTTTATGDTTLTAADLASMWTGRKGLDPVVIWGLDLDTGDDGSVRLTYSWKTTNDAGLVGVSCCCDPAFFLKTYTRVS